MNDLPHVVEISGASFQEQVVEKSHEVPVLVDFWADWCAPCKMLLPVLLKLADEYQGKFQLVKINTEVERELAAQHGIRSLPTLRLYLNGEVVEEILGAQPEAALRTLIDSYIQRESDLRLQEALALHQQGDTSRALALLEQAYRDDPDNPRLPLPFARLCLEDNQFERADQILQALPRELREQPETAGLQQLVELARSLSDAPALEELENAMRSDAGQSAVRYQLAARQTLAADYDNALINFLELLKRDRNYGDGAAQRGLLAIFALLGDQDPRVTSYRRQMFTLLH